MLLEPYRIRLRKIQAKQKAYSDMNFDLINNGDLKKIRLIIRACIAEEKQKIDENHLIDPHSVLSYIRVQQAARSVSDLLMSANLVKSLIKSNLRGTNLIYPLNKKWQYLFSQNGVSLRGYSSLIQFFIYRIKSLVKNYYKALILITAHGKDKIFYFEPNSTFIYAESEYKSDSTSPNKYHFVHWLKANKIIDNYSDNVYFLTLRKSMNPNDIHFNDLFNFKFFNTLVTFSKFVKIYKLQFIKLFFIAPNLFIEYTNLNSDITMNVSKLIIPSSMGWFKSTWHLKVEELGTEIIFVNLSDSSEPSATFDHDFPINWYAFSQWKTVTVCSEYQKQIFESQCPKAYLDKITVTGTPDWQESGDLQTNNNMQYISVFDFEPHKDHYGFSCNNDSGYSNIHNTVMFIQSLTEIAQKLGVCLIYKSKRNIPDSSRYKEYKDTLFNSSKTSKFFQVAPELISPRRLIIGSLASIHMPFTSTALIAKELRIPSCFYDVVGLIEENDPGANGIKIINNQHILTNWLSEQINRRADIS